MIQEEKIKNMVFLEQTTYYIYRSNEDWENDKPFLTTSNRAVYARYKTAAKRGKWKLEEHKNIRNTEGKLHNIADPDYPLK